MAMWLDGAMGEAMKYEGLVGGGLVEKKKKGKKK